MSNYDLIIVGAGPPGAGTAIRAAKSGLKTLMIEKGSNLKNRILNVRTAMRFKTDARHFSFSNK